jgi:hypothetical protein
MRVRLVVPRGTIVLAAYRSDGLGASAGDLHDMTTTGTEVIEVEVLDNLPRTVTEDMQSDDWDESVTPVEELEADEVDKVVMTTDDIDTVPIKKVRG